MTLKKRYPSDDPNGRLTVKGLVGNMKETLQIISDNTGIPISQMIKEEIRKLIERTPENLKQKRVN